MSYIRSEYKRVRNTTSGGHCIEIWNKNRYVRNTKQYATVRASVLGIAASGHNGFSVEFGGGVHWTHSLSNIRSVSSLRSTINNMGVPHPLRLKISPLTYVVNLGQTDGVTQSSSVVTINSSATFEAPFTINMAGNTTSWEPGNGQWLLQAKWDGKSVLVIRGGYKHYDSDHHYGSLSAGVFMNDFHFFTQ